MVRLRCPVLVGRDDEARACRDAVASLASGTGGLLTVTGPAGIGKSRLSRTVIDHAVAEQVPVAVGRGVPTGVGLAYRPLAQVLAQLRRDRGDSGDPGPLPWLDGGAAEGAVAGGSPVAHADALVRWLAPLAASGGLLVVLEDLHWADPDTLEVLDGVADTVAGSPVLWLLTGRDDRTAFTALVDRFRERRGVRHLPLARLTDLQTAQMAEACCPGLTDEMLDRVRRHAEGVPLFVEELVATTGLPDSFTAAVRGQVAGLAPAARGILAAAAVLGRSFDPDLLADITGTPAEAVAARLQEAVGCGLLTGEDGPLRFRHALTREAVVGHIPATRRRALAAAALQTVRRAHPGLAGEWLPVAADLAAQAGDDALAGRLLVEAGQRALSAGALATAADALRRAVPLLGGDAAAAARSALVRALTLAGHVENALVAGRPLLETPATHEQRADGLIALAAAAVAGDRWAAAATYLEAVPAPALRGSAARQARHRLLAAQVAFADQRLVEARALADRLLDSADAEAEVRCQALELRGRIARLDDLSAAREAFEQALQLAEAAALPVRRLQALHELGTLELFDSAGTHRLGQARALAEQMGAAGAAAVLDLQLTAAHLSRFDPDSAERHAEAARAWGERLGLHVVTAKAEGELAEVAVQRRQAEQMEHHLAIAAAVLPGDVLLDAFGWGQCRGMLALFEDDWVRALDCFSRAVEVMRRFDTAEPLEFRALWPLLLAAEDDPRAGAALAEADTPNLTVAFANRGLLGYAEAILAGRAGDRGRAADVACGAEAYLVRFPVWRDLARLCAAPAARTTGWGQPEAWLDAARATFVALGLTPLADRCDRLLQRARPATPPGTTSRESEVLALLVEGLANKEIAVRLQLSPRTVEKHVESLMRKTGARSRTQLATQAVALTGGKNT